MRRAVVAAALLWCCTVSAQEAWHHWWFNQTSGGGSANSTAAGVFGGSTVLVGGSVGELLGRSEEACHVHAPGPSNPCTGVALFAAMDTTTCPPGVTPAGTCYRQRVCFIRENTACGSAGVLYFFSPVSSCGTMDADTGECSNYPIPSGCEPFEDDRGFTTLDSAWSAICVTHEGNQCRAVSTGPQVGIGGTWGGNYRITGEGCDSEPEPDSTTPEQTTTCGSKDGVTVCASQNAAPNCGTVNGDYVCVGSLPDDSCTFLSGGGVVCTVGTSSPPAPTESDGMTPAAPEGEFSLTNGEEEGGGEFEYYGPGVVAGSGTPVIGGGAPGTGGESSDGEEGGGECSEPGSCDGELPNGGELEEVDSFGELTGAFLARVEGAPLVSAIGDLGTSMPAGECPAPSTTLDYLDGATITLDAHCTMWPDIATVLSAVMLACWVFIGARIVLSA